MIWIRSTFFSLFFYVWTALVGLTGWVLLILYPSRGAMMVGKLWTYGNILGLKIICGVHYTIEGTLPKDGAILAAKHQSTWETYALYALCNKPVFILKKELLRIPLVGWYLWSVKSIAIDRSGGAKALRKMLQQAESRLQDGYQIVIFPQGTRVHPSDSKPYQPGVAAIYQHTRQPVIPIALDSGKCWPKGSWIKRPCTITVRLLEPIEPGLPKREFMHTLEQRIENAMQDLH